MLNASPADTARWMRHFRKLVLFFGVRILTVLPIFEVCHPVMITALQQVSAKSEISVLYVFSREL